MRNFTLLIFIVISVQISAQNRVQISYIDYIKRVTDNNLELAAEKLNLNIADAKIEISKLFNDPSIGVGYSNVDIAGKKMGSAVSFEISKTLSPGKRAAAIDAAITEKQMSIALLKDYMNNLVSEATLLWIEVIRQQRIYSVEKETYHKIKELAAKDSIRLTKGDINETDAVQSIIEAGKMYHDLLSREAEMHNLQFRLSKFCSVSGTDTIFVPASRILRHQRVKPLNEIVSIVMENRADLAAAEADVRLSEKLLKIAQISRRPDIDVSVGVNLNRRAYNMEAPSPPHSEVYMGLSIPIQISKSLYRGEIRQAEALRQQSVIRYQNALLQIESDVVEAYNLYIAKDRQLKSYSDGLLLQAKRVLEEKKRGYNSGETPFLEVLDAQRTYDEILISYYNTFYDKTAALINLERAAGYWDLE